MISLGLLKKLLLGTFLVGGLTGLTCSPGCQMHNVGSSQVGIKPFVVAETHEFTGEITVPFVDEILALLAGPDEDAPEP